MPSENARAMARRVYDRTNDLATIAIRLSNFAANATGHADNDEAEEAIKYWLQMATKLDEVGPAVEALVEQLHEAVRETR